MSKRFGRNQRRKLRLEVEAQGLRLVDAQAETTSLKRARELDHGLMKDFQLREREHRDALAYIVDVIAATCENSVLLPPKTMVVDAELVRDGMIRCHLLEPIQIPPKQGFDRLEERKFEVLTLRRLISAVRRDAHALGMVAHMEVRTHDSPRAYYFISDKALALGLPRGKRAQIAEDMCRELLRLFDQQTLAPHRYDLAMRRQDRI